MTNRLGVAVLAATTLAALAATGAFAKGPRGDLKPCADIVEGQASYDTSPDTGLATVTTLISLQEPACDKGASYVLHILAFDSATQTPGREIARAKGISDPSLLPNEIGFLVPFASNPPTAVCIFVTSGKGRRVADRAPDVGCVDLGLDGGSGARAFQG